MIEQLGFGFLPDCKPIYRELPAGSWHSPCFTAKEYGARLERARNYLPSVMWPAREIYRRGLESAKESFDQALPGDDARDAAAREWPKQTLQVGTTQRTAFVDHCISMVDGEWDMRARSTPLASNSEVRASKRTEFLAGVPRLGVPNPTSGNTWHERSF